MERAKVRTTFALCAVFPSSSVSIFDGCFGLCGTWGRGLFVGNFGSMYKRERLFSRWRLPQPAKPRRIPKKRTTWPVFFGTTSPRALPHWIRPLPGNRPPCGPPATCSRRWWNSTPSFARSRFWPRNGRSTVKRCGSPCVPTSFFTPVRGCRGAGAWWLRTWCTAWSACGAPTWPRPVPGCWTGWNFCRPPTTPP